MDVGLDFGRQEKSTINQYYNGTHRPRNTLGVEHWGGSEEGGTQLTYHQPASPEQKQFEGDCQWNVLYLEVKSIHVK